MDDIGYLENLGLVARKMGTDVLIPVDLYEFLLNRLKEQSDKIKSLEQTIEDICCG